MTVASARLDRSAQISGWLFVAPALVLLGLFMIYPILWSLWMSFQVGKGMNFQFRRLRQYHPADQRPGLPRAP